MRELHDSYFYTQLSTSRLFRCDICNCSVGIWKVSHLATEHDIHDISIYGLRPRTIRKFQGDQSKEWVPGRYL